MKISKYYGFFFLLFLFACILYFPEANFLSMKEGFQSLATFTQPLLYDTYQPNYQHNGVGKNEYGE